MQDRAAVMAILKMRLTEQRKAVVRQLMQSHAARGEAGVSDQRITEYMRRVVDHTRPQDIDVPLAFWCLRFLIAGESRERGCRVFAGGGIEALREDPTTGGDSHCGACCRVG